MNKKLFIESLSILADSDARLFAETIKQYGFEVIGMKRTDPLEKDVQLESIASMASLITESIDEDMELNEIMGDIKKIAESRGYIIRLIDENEESLPPPPSPPSPPRKSKHPMPEPAYPGSSRDKARKAVAGVKRPTSDEIKAQRKRESHNSEGNPFGAM